MRPIPLFGDGVASYSQVATSQRRLNCLYDVRVDQDKAGVIIIGTPGMTTWITLPTYPVYGWRVVGSALYVVSGNRLYRVYDGGSYSELAALPTVSRNVGMSDNTAQLIIVDGVAGYVYTFATNTLSGIVDVNFPNGCTSVTFLNSKFYAAVPGTRIFVASQPLDGTAWTPHIFGTKENASDLLLGVDVINGTLILWGQLTTEFWQDVGSSPLAVQRINGSTQNWGLAAIYSHAHVGNTSMFLGTNPDGGICVLMLNGYVATPVSSSDIDAIIQSFSTVEDAVALVYTIYGHSIYQLTFPSEDRTLCYDLKTKMWHEAQSGLGIHARHAANLGVAFAKRNYVSDFTTGSIYLMDPSAVTDAGLPIRREVCTRHIRADGNDLILDQFVLEFETGVGTEDCTDPVVFISVSKDGGRSFGPELPKPLGAVGKFIRRARWKRLGQSTDFVIKIAVTDPVKFVLASGQASVDVVDA